MRCTDVETLLPLHAGGDLEHPEAADVVRHLSACARCAASSREHARSRAWLVEAARGAERALDESFHADVRRTVLLELRLRRAPGEARRARGLRWLAPALAAAAAVLLAVLAVRPRPVVREAPAPPGVVSTAPRPEPPVVARTRAEEPRPAARPRRRRATSAVVPARVTRIEMQTPNPNVRIIWLARAS
jgi:putative zinc finger protein